LKSLLLRNNYGHSFHRKIIYFSNQFYLQVKILLVEDDSQIASFVKLGLESNQFFVDVAYDGVMGEKLALQKKYDVIILDVILPGINGFQLCQVLRNNNLKTPILMLTSLNSTEDKVTGFESGADDYLLKPFAFQELLARIKALNRRNSEMILSPAIKVRDLELNTVSRRVKRSGKEIKLTTLEYKLLELLVSHPGKVFERIEISEKIWGTSFNTGTNFINVHINSLRNKIDKEYADKLIHTVKGIGYVIKDED
jgi:two-component system, OmpR family, copper resistance phosphate regulon response regulator CusR